MEDWKIKHPLKLKGFAAGLLASNKSLSQFNEEELSDEYVSKWLPIKFLLHSTMACHADSWCSAIATE
jgi:hypothetical protein